MCQLAVGMVLYGYCNGFFGDSTQTKRVEAFGVDWIVAREIEGDGAPLFCQFDMHRLARRDELIARWASKGDWEQ